MNNNELLTIAIPTYNRIAKVVERVGELLPQLSDRTEVRIFDNASDLSVEDAVRSRYGDLINDKFVFYRNRGNIGLAANLCRCFELAQGDWIWILGDDDAVYVDALEKIFSEIAAPNNDSLAYISFSTSIYSHKSKRNFAQLSGFTNSSSPRACLSNLLFISSGCYRVSKVLPHLRAGYLMIYSHVPHVAILASMLADGQSDVLTTDKTLVERSPYDPKQAWSYLKVISGLPSLIDLEGIDPAISEVVAKIISDIRWRPFLAAGIHYIFNDSGRPLRFWSFLLIKIFVFGEFKMKARSLILMATLPFAAFVPTRAIVRRIINAWMTADVNEGANRL